MENIRELLGLTETPRPCDYFSLIGGTSTGGYAIPLYDHFTRLTLEG